MPKVAMVGDATSGRSKSGMSKLLRRMDPVLRDEYLKEQNEIDRSFNVRKKDNGKFCVSVNASMNVKGEYKSVYMDKEFDTAEAATEFGKKIFIEPSENQKSIEEY